MSNDFRFFCFIFLTVLLFFLPVFSLKIPFPGDLLINENPYKEESYLGYNPGSYPHKAQGPDVITHIYPWKYFATQELAEGKIPFWNPYNFSGNPQMANFQTAVFYPLNILYLIFPFDLAWTIFIMLQPILAGIFIYIFLSKGLNLERFPSFLGGIIFAFSSYMTVWIEYGNIGSTILWLPLVLFLVKRLYERSSGLFFLLLVLSLTFSLLAGYIQGFFYIYTLSFAYFVFLLKFGKSKFNFLKIFLFLSAHILPLVLGAFQLLSTYELFTFSSRGSYSLSQISNLLLPPYYWITALAPDFFGNPATRNYFMEGTYIERVMYAGIPILFFAFLAIKFIKSREVAFFAFIAGLSLILATDLPGVKYFYLLPIPVVSTTVPTRELSIFIFSVIILGSIGLNYFIQKKKIVTKLPILFILLFIIFWIAAFILNFQVSQRNLILPSVLLLATVSVFYTFRRFEKLSLIALTFVVVFDLLYFFNKITPFSPPEFAYPETPVVSYIKENGGINRFWGYGSAYIKPNFQTVDKTYSPEGIDPLHLASYTELVSSTASGEIPQVLPRPDANIAPGYGLTDLRSNFYRQRVLNLLGVKYVLHKNDGSDTFPSETYTLVFETGKWQIYENKAALPRFFMVGEYSVAKDKSEVLSKIYDEDFNMRDTLILEKEPMLPIESDFQGEVELLSYEPNKVFLKTESSGNSLLFLSDNYYPGWKVSVDGQESEVLVANYSFRAVEVPKGEHTVEFYYYPEKFLAGLKISGLGLISLFGLVGLARYGKK